MHRHVCRHACRRAHRHVLQKQLLKIETKKKIKKDEQKIDEEGCKVTYLEKGVKRDCHPGLEKMPPKEQRPPKKLQLLVKSL